MKKITSLMMMLVLCSAGVFGQAATEWADRLIRIGTAQSEMVPGKWYFLHNSRMPSQGATEFAMPGGNIPGAGGLVTDKGIGSAIMMSAATDIDVLTMEDGTSANDHMDKLVRFVAVAGKEGAYNIQFGTGNWLADSPANGTVNNNQYIAGQAGQYNFYLIKFNGVLNNAGRFGWNKYDMQDRVDNNGAGNGVVFWDSGESLAGTTDIEAGTESDIKGNRVWQIYEVEDCGTVDPWESSLDALINTRNSINERDDYSYISNLQAGINVGNSYGNYRPEDVQAFLEYANRVEEILEEVDHGGDIEYLQSIFETVDDVKAYTEAYRAAEEKVRANRIPLAIPDIAPGYYTINSAMAWFTNQKDTIYYTQAEADKYNSDNNLVAGDEGFITTDSIKEVNTTKLDAPVKALCSKDINGTSWLYWANLEQNSQFLWKIENVEGKNTEYRLVNMYRGQTFNNLADAVEMEYNDTVTVIFDYADSLMAPVLNKKVLSVGIRQPYYSTEGDIHYVHCGGHNGGAANEGKIVSWYTDGNQSKWYLEPVDENTADLWINGSDAKVRKMVNEANTIVSTIPAQFEVAKDIKTTIFENDSVVTDASQFYSPYICEDGKLEGETTDDIYSHLLDGNPATFLHTSWEGGDVAAHVHYLQVEAAAALEGSYSVKLARRAGAANDHPVKFAVRGYDTNDESLAYEDGDDLGSLSFPFDGNGTWATANNLFDAKGHSVIRFYWEDSNGDTDRGYWHCSAFNVFRAEKATFHETTQYQVREAIVNRLQAAMDTWIAAEYDSEDGELINDEAFNASYDELVAASEAWKAVYVDPAALREAIADAPSGDLFVTGNNPGQWKEGSVTPVATVDEAKAYDETGAYTPAESERLIKAIADATAEAFAAANKIETGKWYRIKFPTEEMYDTYEWSKAAAQGYENEAAGVVAYPELFGKTAAAGKGVTEYVPYINADGNEDTLATYHTEISEEFFNGHNVCFFDDEQMEEITNGEDLFRFIQATDSSYIIQNKATGLFLRGGQPVTLSDVPTYFQTKALGAGVNLITYTTVVGDKARHCNLHGERATNNLVCWEADAIGSNSALLIEEAGTVTEEPATAYTTRLWPGSVYAYTTPVDVTILGSEATAYGAELVVGNAGGDTAVVLKKIEAETIKAGTPYILIADDVHGEYITPADRLVQIAADIMAGGGKYGYIEKQLAAELRDEEYVHFAMDHGMTVDTLQKGNGDLVGTFRDLTVEAGKGIVTKDNGFAHTLVNTTVGAYGAYVKCDFDAESADVLGTIKVEFNGSIETGIGQVLDKVAKSGNIYSVDGKLVGKGNINSVNNLPAGIYIVNGVKVTKK